MTSICIVTSHPFWSEPLGCGSLMRSRYELLSRISSGLKVIYITRSADQCPLPNSGTLRVVGDFTEEHVDAVKSFVVREGVSTCFFSYAVFDELAERLPCRTIVEVHDVLHLRQESFAQFGQEAPVRISKADEIESLSRFDAVVCINLDEARYLTACGVAGVNYLPPSMSFTPLAGPRSGPVAGLIGSRALPNVDGLRQAIGAIRRLPHVVIAGGLSDDPVLGTVTEPGLERLGVVPDIRRFYERIDVALSPVRFGGGLKIKVFEALAHGKPVIATSHSVAGFPDGIRRVAVVEDDFAAWTGELLQRAAEIPHDDVADYFTGNFAPERCRQALEALL